jgi:hypothetical protein
LSQNDSNHTHTQKIPEKERENTESVGGNTTYHVRWRLEYQTSLFPPLFSVIVLKCFSGTL